MCKSIYLNKWPIFLVTVLIQTSENEHLKIHLISVAKMVIALLPFYQWFAIKKLQNMPMYPHTKLFSNSPLLNLPNCISFPYMIWQFSLLFLYSAIHFWGGWECHVVVQVHSLGSRVGYRCRQVNLCLAKQKNPYWVPPVWHSWRNYRSKYQQYMNWQFFFHHKNNVC